MYLRHTAYTIRDGQTPLITAAIHAGHEVRHSLHPYFALTEEERLREEDPGTEIWAALGESRIIGRRSRFELDLNRPREKAVYLNPEDAWGLQVWKHTPPQDEIDLSLQYYDDFYANLRKFLDGVVKEHRGFVVYDIHSYNHRRDGLNKSPADPEENPEVNIGTGTMNRRRWAPVVDGFIKQMRSFKLDGRQLDVRENIKFQGGEFSRWIHRNYPDHGCVLAIEFKKIYMDEWTGQLDHEVVGRISEALAATMTPTLNSLQTLSKSAGAAGFK